jgi:hypothetical protein
MPRPLIDVDALTIESPCSVPWSSMAGNDVRRFCGTCRLHVYDLSRMTRAEISDLSAETGGRFCKRIWRRPDGRVITKDCGRFRRALERRWRLARAAVAGLFALVGLGGCGGEREAAEPRTLPAAEQPASGETFDTKTAEIKTEDTTVTTGR